MDIDLIVNITARAWALPILAKFNEGVPGRQAPLLAATGASRTAFRQSIEHLINLDLLERNPGHGHPLRPEFRLTPAGHIAAKLASDIVKTKLSQEQILLRRSWTVPVLTTLRTPRHFAEIKRDLTTITDRALSQSLRSMEELKWIDRSVDKMSRPPKPLYSAINYGAIIRDVTSSVSLH